LEESQPKNAEGENEKIAEVEEHEQNAAKMELSKE